MAIVSSTVVRNLAKRKAAKRGAALRSVTSVSVDYSSKRRKVTSPTKSQEVLEESEKIVEGADLRPRFEVEAGLLEEQCRAKAREKMVAVMDDEFKKVDGAGKEDPPARGGEKLVGREPDSGEGSVPVGGGENQKELDIAREREEQTLLYNAEYAEEYEFEETKRQVEEKTTIILSRDLALNQLTSELVELKEKAASGSRHEAELAEYHIRALNEEISDMKCNICAMNDQLLKREIKLDTAQTNLVVSEADFEKLSSSIVGKDRELRNSVQIRDSLIARLDRLKVDLRRLKGRETQSMANLAKIQAKNQSLVDDLAHARGNVRWVVQREKEMNE
ncbi:hypothetical protein GIB67_018369 [Kingdonia uniflora]|uniref:Uncharacterized protein n=1 Tax=Kingdonia uniflora TaxID=39325 RepID=A0A7J7MJD1_9MAGN|nr:hypothetical protein GIB67_018369 [Kingdonia uniflora]